MAKLNTPIFAVGKYDKILPAVTSGTLTYPSYVFCTDTNTMVFVDKDLNLQDLYGYNQDSIIYVNTLPTKNIRSDAFYICNGVGYLYIDSVFVPVFQNISSATSYDSLDDVPIVNKYGTATDIIVISNLDKGCYSVSGQYQITEDDTIYVTSRKVIFLVDADVAYTYITKFGTGEILLYSVNKDAGDVTTDRYATESWIEEHGYATKTYVTDAITEAYNAIMSSLAITKLSQLENDVGFLTKDNFASVSTDEIAGLFD